jgi:hypothetical protein
MESGYVKFFLTSPEKLFGFLVDENGKEVFFHYSNGRDVVVDGPGDVKLVEPTQQLRCPKKGEYLKFERNSNGKGPKASPWCFEERYNYILAQSKRDITLEEAKQFLSDKSCDVFSYSQTSNGMTIVTTEITWLTADGQYTTGRGKFVDVKYTYREPETKARVEVLTPGQKQYTSSKVFTGDKAVALKDKLNVRTANNGVRVGILWNGGWDDYVVDPISVREITEEEAVGISSFPTVSNEHWLRCSFAKKLGADNQVVRILRHLDGGD